MTDRRRFERVAELFESARSLPGADREALLRDARDPPDLIDEVRELLAHHDDQQGVMHASSVGVPAPLAPAHAPETIGRYTIKRRIASGGMGVVYLAQQQSPRRDVAIKVIRPGLVTPELLKRFEHEGAMLGLLKHPNIAQIYEADTYDDDAGSWPYLAMEYVDGAPLLDYARDHDLTTRQRLEMFARVCDAVQHAHQRGVIHRDLKPANILVDAAGEPKVLDFGVARATDADLQASTLHTGAGRLVGTLAYMSPEQVLGRAGDIDVRSDVYALGVLLYELLADRLPYDLADLLIPAAARVISEQEPTSLTTVNKSFRGDLDTIVRKALDKAPDRRYQSAADLAADARHYLNAEPITARPATTLYQLSRFARRNRALVSGVAAAFVALIAGTAFATSFAIGQTRALAESERQREITRAVNDFLTDDLIELVNPEADSDRDMTLLEALDKASGRIEGRFQDAPLVEANLRMTIGKAYRRLGRLDDADAHLTRAHALYAAALGERDEQTLLCQMELISILSDRADYKAWEEAMLEMLEVQREVLGEDHEQTMATVSNLGAAMLGQGRFEEAEPYILAALESRRRVLGEMNEHTATTMNNLGVLYVYDGRLEEAAELLPRTLDILMEVSGERHPQTLQTMVNLGAVYANLGRNDESIATMERAYELHAEALGAHHPSSLGVASSLATLYGRQGLHEQQRRLLNETLAAQRDALGENHYDTLVTRYNLARMMYGQDEFEPAAAECAELVERFSANYPDHFFAGIAGSMLGRSLRELGRPDEAERALLDSHAHLSRTRGAGHTDTRLVAKALADLYAQQNRPEDSQHWQSFATAGQASD